MLWWAGVDRSMSTHGDILVVLTYVYMLRLSTYADVIVLSPYAYRTTPVATEMPMPITSIRDLAVAVRGRRLGLGLSQADVARRARVSRQWIGEIESGKPTAELQLVIRLVDALGLCLSLDERDAPAREPEPAAPAGVDLDALLDEYRQS